MSQSALNTVLALIKLKKNGCPFSWYQMYFVHIFSHTTQPGCKAQAFLHIYTSKKKSFKNLLSETETVTAQKGKRQTQRFHAPGTTNFTKHLTPYRTSSPYKNTTQEIQLNCLIPHFKLLFLK